MTVLMKVIAFLLSVGPLIILHELGHYFAARLCGVKVVRFSIFMGKVLWSRRFGRDQTEWAISAIPIGGYVKMLDDRDPATRATNPEDQKREFTRQNVWKRIFIISAGPIANFIVAIVLFAGLFMHGVPEWSTRLRAMPETTAAWQAGLRGGETVVAVNGAPVEAWSELRLEFMRAVLDKTDVNLEVRQSGGGRMVAVIPAAVLAGGMERDVIGEAGLMVERGPATLGRVFPDGAAARAGLRAGDIITAIDGKATRDGVAVIAAIRAGQGRALEISLLRAGAAMTVTVTPEFDPKDKTARIKAEVLSGPDTIIVSAGPFKAISKAADTTWDQVTVIVKSIGKMFTGEVSLKNVTGPITIADYAGETARHGAIEFLRFIAIISIGIGVMNLLPIPVLDGGLLLYYSLEVLTGRPLSPRIGEYVQYVGYVLFLMLMSLAFYNDVARLLG
jgi:regulator of sigma E protease